MNILFVTAEAAPFVKTGGLGDVAGALPLALREAGEDVRVILPFYSDIPAEYLQAARLVCSFELSLGWRRQYCGLLTLERQGLRYYFIDNEYYFKRSGLYGYFDDGERFSFFSRAVLEALPRIEGWRPDILHCNDWHTALVPLLLQERHGGEPFYFAMRTVFTIHNLKYQGVFPGELAGDILDFPPESYGAALLRYHESVNFMKSALVTADCVTTVSESYAREICEPYFGEGLDPILRVCGERLEGILNGIDTRVYNPAADKALRFAYKGALSYKVQNKVALQKALGLAQEPNTPLCAFISRLTEQKGVDLLLHVLDELLGETQLAVLASGDRAYEEALMAAAARYRGRLSLTLAFDEPLSRRLYAGSDLVLVPSRFEPCGLTQMIAMRYGALPLVRETGGLRDSVIPYNKFTGEGTGFSFANYNAHELLETLRAATALYREERPVWDALAERAMAQDFGWTRSAARYRALYARLLTGDYTL